MKALSSSRDTTYRELKEYVVESTGLAYYQTRDEEFKERIDRRLRLLGITNDRTYLTLLRDSAIGDAEMDHLIAELTIGETFFFRDENQFNAIRRKILPDLLQKNASRKSLRVWSAGCASGAEAYSLSILLRDEFRERISDWEISIRGTDVNRRVLEQARTGLYEKWALRSTSDDMRERCFEAEGERWRVADRYRVGVGFQYHNLVKREAAAGLNGLCAFDLVLCRNVMIYFDRPTAARVVERLHASLLPGAWLVVGHADHDPSMFREFDVVSLDGVSIYRKRSGATATVSAVPQAAQGALLAGPAPLGDALPEAAPDLGGLTFEAGVSVSEQAAATGVDSSQQTLGDVRALADRGASVQAETLCSSLIENSPLEPLPHFYLALILEQLGRCDEAESSLRRSLYLDRRFVLAHYHLGLLLQRGGRRQAARQHFENTLALLAGFDGGFVFEHGDGMRAADLRELTELNLEGL